MPTRLITGLLATGCLLIGAAPAGAAGAPANVSVRVEGAGDTLVPRTALTTTTTRVIKDGNSSDWCTGTSVAGALEQATAGDWSGTWDPSYKYSVQTIKSEAHAFGSGNYWGLFVNDTPSSTGICDTELQTGDEVLFAPLPESGATVGVLRLKGVPATAAPGSPITVTVTRTATTYDPVTYNPTTSAGPGAGVTVSGGGATATTGADGTAQIVLSQTGPASLRAAKAGDIRSASEPVCVTTGADGQCGTAVPTPPSSAAPCATDGRDGLCGTRDLQAPLAAIAGIADRQVFAKGHGPRTVRGSAIDPSGLLMVKVRLTRDDHGRCAYFSGRKERFVPSRCGSTHGYWFRIGDRADWSYLLPSQLPRGRYVLDVNAIDKAYNRDDARRRGGNRVVFEVR
jgi:Domain of unknown function (DUF4430)